MPYGNLERMRVQRFATTADIDAAQPTIEEREEYEVPVALGIVVYAGVDYAAVLEQAVDEADVIVWDGGNNDFPFITPDLLIVVTDPLRAGDELRYHPGETNLRMADVVVINKVDRAWTDALETVLGHVRGVNPDAVVIRAASPVSLGPGPEIRGRRVLVVEDGPTITHGGMPYGAGTVAAQQAHAGTLVDPRLWAVGSIADTFARYPHIGNVLPAMGYSAEQLDELARTIRAVECDVVVTGTPVDLGHLFDAGHPFRHATYEMTEIGHPDLADVLAPFLEEWSAQAE
jgi:predicted GTPase